MKPGWQEIGLTEPTAQLKPPGQVWQAGHAAGPAVMAFVKLVNVPAGHDTGVDEPAGQ
jgi:hypothetical protein